MKGFINLHRQLLEWSWFKKSETVHFFIFLLLSANHADKQVETITVKRGQLLVGRKYLSEKLNMSEQCIRTQIKRLISTNEITTESTSKGTIITICKYDTYQRRTKENNQPINQHINQQLTSDQPATNQQLTTNNNVNNVKNSNNVKNVKKALSLFKNVFPDFVDIDEYENSIEKILQKIEKGLPPENQNDNDILNSFDSFIKNLPQWYHENNSPHLLAKQYGYIKSQIANQKSNGKVDISKNTKEDYERQL